MELHTTAAVISLAKKLEDESARFYEDLSGRYPVDAGFFLSLVKENKDNVTRVERAYYSVISDAIEGCFAFNIDPDEYAIKTELATTGDYPAALRQAIDIEDRMARFYSNAAAQSKPLMADVPRIFAIIARKRDDRRTKLRSLGGE